jgi:hypothetical protein
MKTFEPVHECPHEDDVLAAVSTGRWPERVEPELRAHVAQCEVCRDVVVTVAAFAEDAEIAEIAEGAEGAEMRRRLPDAGAVWLRAQLKARVEATRLAERPITVAQAIGFASMVGLLGALFGAASPWLQNALQWTNAAVARLDPRGLPVPTGIWTVMVEHAGITALIVAALMATPVAVYWAMREN